MPKNDSATLNELSFDSRRNTMNKPMTEEAILSSIDDLIREKIEMIKLKKWILDII